MNIAVSVNMIPDPEAPPEKFRLTPGAVRPDEWTGAFVVGPFDQNALELALQQKDRLQSRVHAICVGEKRAQTTLRKTLSVKVDGALWVQADPEALDSGAIAKLLAAAVRKLGDVDLVLCGRQSGDWDSGVVGLLLAEELGFSALALVRQIEQVDGGEITALREMDGGVERVAVKLPAVLTVTNEPSNQLRVAKVRDIMMSERQPITTLTPGELGLSDRPEPTVRILGLRPPPGERRKAEIVNGDSAADKAAKLADRLLQLIAKG